VGIHKDVADRHSDTLQSFAVQQLLDGLSNSRDGAVILAGLYEASVGKASDGNGFYGSASQRDRAWWLGLKRKLYGWDKRWSEPLVCPKPLEGTPSSIIREGTLSQAGMKPDAHDKIDGILTEWYDNTNEAFAVCIARHGVVVIHKAYGIRDGKPMTLQTKSWMASTSKLLSGTLIMMLVDQGLMNLDDPIQDYLPALSGIETREPLTIRRLYNHTDDLDWHYGGGTNDMGERIGALLPLLNVGGQYRYSGTGMELACKALEAISGETLPMFFKKHLLDPLACENTTLTTASAQSRSVPLDLAKIGQMLLNKGCYGNMRFFSEATFGEMLPKPVIINQMPSKTEYGECSAFCLNPNQKSQGT